MESTFRKSGEKSPFHKTKPRTSFKQLGGSSVTLEEVQAEVGRCPLDGLLRFLAMLSLDAVQKGQDFFDARHQGEYLNLAIVDDFPSVLPRASNMYAPGRVPITGGRHVFIDELNMAQLSHIAIVNAKEGRVTAGIGYDLSRRAFRLLLILNDLFPGRNTSVQTIRGSLVERRKFALEWLRYYQFNRFFNSANVTMAKLARQKILLLKILPEFFEDTERAFRDATGGVGLQRYFEILTVVLSHVYYQMKAGNHWFRKQEFTSQLKAGSEEVDLVMQRWTRTPQQYRAAFTEWNLSRSLPGATGFDFVPLRIKPLIEARPDELVCPVLPFLLAKIEDDPYFILSEYLDNPGEFQKAVGLAYQKYASSLVERISKGDFGGAWTYQPSPTVKGDVQLADDYLQRGDIGICFEHKGGRPGTDFLRGGGGDQLLGPDDDILGRLDQKEPVSCREGREQDNGVLTRGMWQQSLHGATLVNWAERKTGTRPSRVWAILTHLCNILVDDVVYPVYMGPLMEAAQLYDASFWQKPQWLHIDDLETLAALSEQGSLDLAALLHQKLLYHKTDRFDVFLYERFGGTGTIDRRLMDEARRLLYEAKVTFWAELQEPDKSF